MTIAGIITWEQMRKELADAYWASPKGKAERKRKRDQARRRLQRELKEIERAELHAYGNPKP